MCSSHHTDRALRDDPPWLREGKRERDAFCCVFNSTFVLATHAQVSNDDQKFTFMRCEAWYLMPGSMCKVLLDLPAAPCSVHH